MSATGTESEFRRWIESGECGVTAAGEGDTGVRMLISPRGVLGRRSSGRLHTEDAIEFVEFRR